MTAVSELRSGKTHRDENFPVASLLVRAEHRRPIFAFYEFARVADDVADHPSLTPDKKVELLDRMEGALIEGERSQVFPEAAALRIALAEYDLSPLHAQDLLQAFRLDARKRRWESWAELMAYCELSAMPVGRFVLDVHGESPATWPASDALCAALQINNHLQDCGHDYRNLDRVYLPLDDLARHGADVESLGKERASTPLRRCISDLAHRVEGLLQQSDGLGRQIADWRLGLEISVIHALAARIARTLIVSDPLSAETHLGPWSATRVALLALVGGATQRFGRLEPRPAVNAHEVDADIDAGAEPGRTSSGSSFHMAMRLMPAERREAMFEIYAFCRAVDDVADGEGPGEMRLAQLQQWRLDIAAIYAGHAPVRLRRLAKAVHRFDLRQRDFMEVIDGMEMDVGAPIRAPDWKTLDLYCDRVASAVGRLCVRIFGMGEPEGVALAHHLGRALQLTNILRDIDEDAEIGRLYLPREALCAAGIASTVPQEVLIRPELHLACAAVVERAEQHFREADAIIHRGVRHVVRPARIMSAVYRSLLGRLVERGWTAPRATIKRGRLQLFWVILWRGLL